MTSSGGVDARRGRAMPGRAPSPNALFWSGMAICDAHENLNVAAIDRVAVRASSAALKGATFSRAFAELTVGRGALRGTLAAGIIARA